MFSKCDIPTLFPTFGRDFEVNGGYCLLLRDMIKRETLRARKVIEGFVDLPPETIPIISRALLLT